MHTAVMLSKHNISDSDKNSDDDNDDIVVDKSPDFGQVTAMSSWKQRCLRLFYWHRVHGVTPCLFIALFQRVVTHTLIVLPLVFSSHHFNAFVAHTHVRVAFH